MTEKKRAGNEARETEKVLTVDRLLDNFEYLRSEAFRSPNEVEFGRVYRWSPECLVVECECGERLTLTSSVTVCHRCGLDHAATVQEELSDQRPEDKALHPWRYWGSSDGTGIPY